MIYYQKINLKNEDIIVDRYKSMIDIPKNSVATQLSIEDHIWLEDQIGDDLFCVTGKSNKIQRAFVFRQSENHKRIIHTDNPSDVWALNIPLLNCETSEMSWYDGEYDKELITKSVGLVFSKLIWKQEPIKVASTFLDSPVIVRIDQPHSVENFSSEPRTILSIRYA